jgi:hypothetical protein
MMHPYSILQYQIEPDTKLFIMEKRALNEPDPCKIGDHIGFIPVIILPLTYIIKLHYVWGAH